MTRNQVPLQIEVNNSIVITLNDLPESKPYAFSRVPAYVRQTNDNFYHPMVIAIGPYHHGSSHLQAMEKHKWRYLRNFLKRSTHREILNRCLTMMHLWEKDARSYYNENFNLTKDDFVEMMLLDGCFILELAFKLHSREHIDLGRGFDYLHLDLLSLENQIPFFIIQKLFNLYFETAERLNHITFFELMNCLCLMAGDRYRVQTRSPSSSSNQSEIDIEMRIFSMGPIPTPPDDIHHLLHYYYYRFVPTNAASESYHRSPLLEKLCSRFPWMSETTENSRKPNFLIPSASVLHEAGVTFRKNDSPLSNLDVTFRNGLMEIPALQLDDFSKPLFTNLIAFEQSMPKNKPRTFTSFCMLMDSLINTEKDVALLQQCGIINNLLGSEEEVARFFNHLCEYALMDLGNHYFSELFRHVNCYYDFTWNRYRARLAHDYFSNPWSTLSVVAALILLILTFLQTLYTIESYIHR